MSRPFPDNEPPAAQREFARALRGMFVAMVQEGFTETQAMTAITAVIAGAINKNT